MQITTKMVYQLMGYLDGISQLSFNEAKGALEAALSAAEPVSTAPAVAVKDTPEALEQFTAYFVKNYPGPDTVIFDPKWHAPKIFRAAVSAFSAQVQDVAGWRREHEALGELIRLLEAEPSIGDAEMADALEHARCVWDHYHAPAGSPAAPAKQEGGTNE
ncbi:hypothetical protein AT6N2_C0370 [Agrobacterium tumefaciens]|uniref:hypothetical protein n=1 Tax=Agrobacterium tumefaciens TaxID=358 RepID=UPI001ADA1AEE|nr:hypothetical protein [Agrobacterium tumefaciens]QTK78280.1 hypothetical protein AT6N2_C0370 [Agrobacterium tumefaciens]